MNSTDDLISVLSDNASPVKPIHPWRRATAWLLFAACLVGILIAIIGIRPDLWERLRNAPFAVCLGASVITGVTGALAAFAMSLPGRSRWLAALPLPSALVWVSTIGFSCITNWISVIPGTVHLGDAATCVGTMLVICMPLWALMLLLMRFIAPLQPLNVMLMGSFAVGALTSSALTVLYPLDASVMLLGWNIGIAALFTLIARLFGRRIFGLIAPRIVLGRVRRPSGEPTRS